MLRQSVPLWNLKNNIERMKAMPDAMNMCDKLNPENQEKVLRLLLTLLRQGEDEVNA